MAEKTPNSDRRTLNSKPIRVLVVDDSSFMRKSLSYLLESDNSIDVIDTASEGEEAIRKVKQLHPEVVLLDIAMPVMDGLTALAHIMNEKPTPVLVLSGVRDSKVAIKALEHGAVDFIKKPSGVISYDIEKIKEEIIYKVKVAAGVDIKRLEIYTAQPRPAAGTTHLEREEVKGGKEIVVIGASTGGPRALTNILSGIPRNISSAIIIVQHMTPEFIPSFTERLQWVSPLDISVAQEDDVISPGRVLIAPGGRHTIITQSRTSRRIHLNSLESEHGISPSVDFAMESAAELYGEKTLGVLLTGMGHDGAKGMKAVKEAGGSTIAEDEATCVVFGMPKAAIELGCIDEILPLHEIAGAIMRFL